MELNYKKCGKSGPCLIIIHGLLGSLDNWQTIAQILSEQYQVYSIDQRNHGRSPHSSEINYQILVEDLNNFIQQHQLENIVLMGHSMGGKVAMLFALTYPERLNKLIVVDIAPKKYTGGHELILETMLEADLSLFDSRKDIEQFFIEKLKSKSLVLFVTKNLGRHSDNTFYWKCNLDSIAKHYDDLMDFPASDKIYSGHTFFIKGTLSSYIQESDHIFIQKFFPHAKVFDILNASHWVHCDNTNDFINTIQYILQENG